MTDILIEGGRALLGEEFGDASLQTTGREIASVGSDQPRAPLLTALAGTRSAGSGFLFRSHRRASSLAPRRRRG